MKSIGSQIAKIPGILTLCSWELALTSSGTQGAVKTISGLYLQRC